MVVTAAAITATGAIASAGIGAASKAGAFGGGGGGGGGSPTVKNLPQNMQDKAIQDYNERLVMANETKLPPSFASALGTGNVGANSAMQITDPGMTPMEAAGAGFVDRHGNPMPTVTQGDLSTVSAQGLSPQQRFMLAKQQMWRANDYGAPVPGWAAQVTGRASHINAVDQRISDLQSNPNANQNLVNRLQQKSATMKANQNKVLGGSYYS